MFDLVIEGAAVLDGTGVAAYTADVAITDGTIREVGRVGGRAQKRLSAQGAWLTPGFVDLHTHCLLYTSPSPRDLSTSRMPSSA